MRGSSTWLTATERDLIVDSALRILEKTGMKMAGARALGALGAHGARIDAETGIVRFPEEVVRNALDQLPAVLTMAGATPEQDVVLDRHSGPFFNCSGCVAKTLDFRTGEKRASTLRDLREGTIVMDATPELDILWTFLTANDVPLERRELIEYYEYLSNTTKPLIFVDCPTEVDAVRRIAEVVGGGLDAFRARPRMSVLCAVRAPLQVEAHLLDTTCDLAALGMPVWAYTMPISGATGPITIAGTLALMWAELLGLLTAIQSTAPGAAILACCGPGLLDMQATTMSLGCPENTLAAVLSVDIAHHLGLPLHNAALATDALHPGFQAGYEKGLKVLPAALSGCDVISGGFGTLNTSNMHYLPMVPLDAEVAVVTRRLIGEVEISAETIMEDMIERVGIGGDFLKERATRQRVRAGEVFMPKMGSRLPYDQWVEAGRTEIDAACETVERSLAESADSPSCLPDDQRAELGAICGVAAGD
jgi:trimethylamine--corrinoid protein Co-methyltransferase